MCKLLRFFKLRSYILNYLIIHSVLHIFSGFSSVCVWLIFVYNNSSPKKKTTKHTHELKWCRHWLRSFYIMIIYITSTIHLYNNKPNGSHNHVSIYVNWIILYSKTIPWFSPMHKEGNELCIIYTLIYGCFHRLESVL